jgi:hypothetical protein
MMIEVPSLTIQFQVEMAVEAEARRPEQRPSPGYKKTKTTWIMAWDLSQ